jgi:hypothetical protein
MVTSLAIQKSTHLIDGGFLPYSIVSESVSIFEALKAIFQPKIICTESLFIFDLGSDGLNGVRMLDPEGDGFPAEEFDKDFHSRSQDGRPSKKILMVEQD